MNSTKRDFPSDMLADGGGRHPPSKRFKYERLDVYQRLRALRKQFYGIARLLPREERFNMRTQLERSALSAVLNVAEGVMRTHGKDQARFTETAYGSLHEAYVCIGEAEEEGFISVGTQGRFFDEVERVSKMLASLRRYQLSQP